MVCVKWSKARIHRLTGQVLLSLTSGTAVNITRLTVSGLEESTSPGVILGRGFTQIMWLLHISSKALVPFFMPKSTSPLRNMALVCNTSASSEELSVNLCVKTKNPCPGRSEITAGYGESHSHTGPATLVGRVLLSYPSCLIIRGCH